MERKDKLSKTFFGLIGRHISYSFSSAYFSEKFKNLELPNHKYVNFDLDNISDITEVFNTYKNSIKGFNVTIPYKQAIIQYLDELDQTAKKVGAVNTVKCLKKGTLKGYNSDVVGFENSLTPLLKKHHSSALILGTGGASAAVSYVLNKLGIASHNVSRNPRKKSEISYSELTESLLKQHTIIINASPVGTFPNTDSKPLIPYQYLTKKHLLYDLIYNPEQTAFLVEGKRRGAQIKNGLEMLVQQAEESWRIWNK